jgi:UDP-N-acetylmuramate--alanine ligase
MDKLKKIHFVGIKGVGMTPLAIIAKEAGLEVTGSDVAERFITDSALENVGITPLIGFIPEHITRDIQLVITTGAHGGYENAEVIKARELSIPVITAGEAVGEFMRGDILGKRFTGISIAGSHGKTTTTAMLTTIFKENSLDPSYLIGTGSFGESLPGHFGKGSYFIAEADEYATEPKHNHKARFLWQHPTLALFTNIEQDHPDIYPTIESIVKVFEEFALQIPSNGVLVGNGDNNYIEDIFSKMSCRTITFGFSPRNDYVIDHIHVSGNQTFFRAHAKEIDLGEFRLSVTGEHNALNALGAVILALESGLPLEKIKIAIAKYSGSKRRLEYKGQLVSGAHIFDDYAHHPTEIKATLKSLRQRFPQSTLIAVFQPHTYTRTKTLLEEFVKSFDDAHNVIITDIFASAREAKDETISSQILVQKLAARHPACLYLPSPKAVIELLIHERLKENVVVVFMGAGDIYQAIDLLPFK